MWYFSFTGWPCNHLGWFLRKQGGDYPDDHSVGPGLFLLPFNNASGVWVSLHVCAFKGVHVGQPPSRYPTSSHPPPLSPLPASVCCSQGEQKSHFMCTIWVDMGVCRLLNILWDKQRSRLFGFSHRFSIGRRPQPSNISFSSLLMCQTETISYIQIL